MTSTNAGLLGHTRRVVYSYMQNITSMAGNYGWESNESNGATAPGIAPAPTLPRSKKQRHINTPYYHRETRDDEITPEDS